MNEQAYISVQETIAIEKMRNLYHKLTDDSGELGTLFSAARIAERTVKVRSGVIGAYVGGDKKVLEFDHRIGQSTHEKPCRQLNWLGEKKCRALGIVKVDGIPYLAAGYNLEMRLVNIRDDIDEHQMITVDKDAGSRSAISYFKNMAVSGDGLDEGVLLAAHSDFGVLRVPLADIRRGAVRIGTEKKVREKYFQQIGQKNNPKKREREQRDLIRLTTGAERVAVSRGDRVYELETGLDKITELYRLNSNGPEQITALAIRGDKIYAGTIHGRIYQNCGLWCNLNNYSAQINKIVPISDSVVLFSTVSNRLNGPLRAAQGERFWNISRPLSSVVDFSFVDEEQQNKSVIILAPDIMEKFRISNIGCRVTDEQWQVKHKLKKPRCLAAGG